jgi:hypothetical protein
MTSRESLEVIFSLPTLRRPDRDGALDLDAQGVEVLGVEVLGVEVLGVEVLGVEVLGGARKNPTRARPGGVCWPAGRYSLSMAAARQAAASWRLRPAKRRRSHLKARRAPFCE